MILDDLNIDEATEYVYRKLFGEKEKAAPTAGTVEGGERKNNKRKYAIKSTISRTGVKVK